MALRLFRKRRTGGAPGRTLAHHIGAATRWGRLGIVLLLGSTMALALGLAVLLAWHPRLRVQGDWTATGELSLADSTRERLARLEEPVEITAFFSGEPTRKLKILEWLCLGSPRRESYARQEIAVRLEAIERVEAWLDRLAFAAVDKVQLRLLDRARRPLEYESALGDLGLYEDGRLLQMLGGYDKTKAHLGQREVGRIMASHPALTKLVERELPAKLGELYQAEYVDFVFFRRGEQSEILFLEPDLVTIEHCHLWSQGPERPPQLLALRVEEAAMAAIERLQPAGAVNAAWIAGHDERPMGAYPVLLGELTRLGIRVSKAPLDLETRGVPPDIHVLISIAPRTPFTEREGRAIREFVLRGGGLLAVEGARRGPESSCWNPVLAPLGLEFLPGRVSQAARAEDLGSSRCATLRIETFNTLCEISAAYAAKGWRLAVRDAVAVKHRPNREVPEGVAYGLLALEVPGRGSATPSPEQLARCPWIDAGEWNLKPDPGEDRGEYRLGMALDLAGAGRVLALGSAEMFKDADLRSDPRFVSQGLIWVAQRPVSPGGPPRRPAERRFEVDGPLGAAFPAFLAGASRADAWSLLCRFAFPGLAFGLGFLFWWLRRRA